LRLRKTIVISLRELIEMSDEQKAQELIKGIFKTVMVLKIPFWI